MPKISAQMTDRQLRSLKTDKACGVVPGLAVEVRKLKDGSIGKYFYLRYRKNNQQAKFFLGIYPQMSLSEAFAKAKAWKAKLDAGENPSEQVKLKQKENVFKKSMSVEDLVWAWLDFESERGTWNMDIKKTKPDMWHGYLKHHFTKELREMPVNRLTADMLAEHFREKWISMVDTPERILGDLRRAIDWGIRQNKIPNMENPAKIKDGRLGDLLPLKRAAGGNHPSLPPDRIPDFFVSLAKAIPASQSARCLAFAILTAARNSTAREATWDEMVLTNGKVGPYHQIPRERMKIKGQKLPFDRKTPLSKEAIGLLKTAPRMPVADGAKDWVFPNIRNGVNAPVSDNMLTLMIKNMHVRDKKQNGVGWVDPNQITNTGEPRRVCQHGLARASFKTWANDAAGYHHSEFKESTLESCLDHRHEKYANAYDREQAMGDMRKVFDEWGEFCYSKLTPEQKKTLGV